jgi:hypothetical protein
MPTSLRSRVEPATTALIAMEIERVAIPRDGVVDSPESAVEPVFERWLRLLAAITTGAAICAEWRAP